VLTLISGSIVIPCRPSCWKQAMCLCYILLHIYWASKCFIDNSTKYYVKYIWLFPHLFYT
jgi:hypothetical protein